MTINNIPCPIYYVTSTQLSVVVPYGVASNQTGLANIQVTNNNVKSNIVQMYLTDAEPGSFAQNANGIGYAAATHAATGQLITPANPVQPGEYISLYLTGLGTVTPTVSDGVVRAVESFELVRPVQRRESVGRLQRLHERNFGGTTAPSRSRAWRLRSAGCIRSTCRFRPRALAPGTTSMLSLPGMPRLRSRLRFHMGQRSREHFTCRRQRPPGCMFRDCPNTLAAQASRREASQRKLSWNDSAASGNLMSK